MKKNDVEINLISPINVEHSLLKGVIILIYCYYYYYFLHIILHLIIEIYI